MLLVFKASSMKRPCFCRFLLNNKKFAFIELTSFKRFDSKVPSFYFGSMPPFAHSCKSASKPLHAQYCTWGRSRHGRHDYCASYTVFTRFGCTATPHGQL